MAVKVLPNPTPGASIEVKMDATDDGSAIRQFEEWARRTGRARFLDFSTIRTRHDDEAGVTYVSARQRS